MEVELLEFADLLQGPPLLEADPDRGDEEGDGKPPDRARPGAAPAGRGDSTPRKGQFGPGRPRCGGAGQRAGARLLEAIDSAGAQTREPPIEVARELPGEFGISVGHSVIPLALSIRDKAWTAREQCVFTLPSEQPIAAAVSATSNSSQ